MGKKQLKQRIADLEQQVADLEAELAARPETWRLVPITLPYDGKWHNLSRWHDPAEIDNSAPVGNDYPTRLWSVSHDHMLTWYSDADAAINHRMSQQ